MVLSVLILSAASFGVGRLTAGQIEQAKVASVPAATVPIKLGVLSDDVTLRGTVTRELQTDLRVDQERLEGRKPIITSLPVRSGQTLNEGDLLLEVAGFPTIVMQGDIPAYRDLVPGQRGSDIRQMQQALRRVGAYRGKVEGSLDGATMASLKALFRKQGYADSDQHITRASILYVPKLPATVTTVSGRLGGKSDGIIAHLSAGQPSISLSPTIEESVGLAPGQHATATASSGTIELLVDQVQSPEPISTQDNADSRQNGVVVTLRPLRGSLRLPEGEMVTVSVHKASSSGPVLSVPVTAVGTKADGTQFVTVQNKTGRLQVNVKVGFGASGLVAVQPDMEADLQPGQQVFVGQ